MKNKFKGIYTVAVTPFQEDGSFDIESAKNHLDWLVSNGIQGICILGATGEYQSVSNEEHKEYVRRIVPYIKDRASVLVGVSRERPDDVIDLMNNAQQSGAKAAMILSPFYCHPCQEEILENYRYIASKSSLPMIVYNNPGSAGVDIDRKTLQEIFRLPTARMFKESTGDIHRLTQAVLDAPDHTSIFCGCDNLAMESFVMGAAGWISMAANFAPKDCMALLEAVETGALDRAKEIYTRLLPALDMLEQAEKPAATIKYILAKYRGIAAGHMRRPRLNLTAKEKAEVDAIDFANIH